jgi:hypothetical protein
MTEARYMDVMEQMLEDIKSRNRQKEYDSLSQTDKDNIKDVNTIQGNLVNLIKKHIDMKKYKIGAPRSGCINFAAASTNIGYDGYDYAFRLVTNKTDKFQAYLINGFSNNGRFDIPITTALPWLQIDQNAENAPTFLETTLKSLSEHWIPIVTMFWFHLPWNHAFEIGTTESTTHTLYNMRASSTRSLYTPRETTIHQAATENSFIVTQGKITETVPFTDMDTKITAILSIHAPRMPWNEQYNEQHLRLITLID